MSQKKTTNEHLFRVRSERLEGLLDLYTRGVINLEDFVRLKSEVKIPAAAKTSSEPDEPRSGSTKKQELRQIRDEIRRREHVTSDQIELPRHTDLSLYSSSFTSNENFTTEPLVTQHLLTELVTATTTSRPALRLDSPAIPMHLEEAENTGADLDGEKDVLNYSGNRWSFSGSLAALRWSPGSIVALVATFVAASVLTIGIARSGPVNDIVNTLQPQSSAASTYASQSELNTFIKPRFGPQAVRRCIDSCKGQNGESVCERACNHLTLTEFARRITKNEVEPAAEARSSANQCSSQAHRKLAEVNRAEWMRTTNELVETLNRADENRTVSDFSRARLEHDRLNQLNEAIAVPTKASLSERTLSAELARASCLRVNLDLGEMALVLSRQGSDPYSERFYQRYYEQLHPTASSAEKGVFDLVKKISVLENVSSK